MHALSRILRLVLVGLLVAFLLGATNLARADVYEIHRADPDGGNLELILDRAGGLAIGHIAFDPDPSSTPMYWSALEPWYGGPINVRGVIRRAGYLGDGNTPIVHYRTGPVAIDPVHDKVYYVGDSDYSPSGRIYRADLDGSNAEELVGQYDILCLAVDPSGGKIYWGGETYDINTGVSLVGVWVADLDGSQPQLLIATGMPYSLAIDASAGKLYWTGYWEGKIRTANIDGSGVEDLVPDVSWPRGLAIDPDGDRIWWSESGGVILRAHLDGSGATQVLSGLAHTRSLAYVPDAGPDGEKLYIVTNPGDVDIPVPAVSIGGAMVLGLLLVLAASVLLSRRRPSPGGRA